MKQPHFHLSMTIHIASIAWFALMLTLPTLARATLVTVPSEMLVEAAVKLLKEITKL